MQYKQSGGEMKALYKEYINGKNNSSDAINAYEKLNRIHYTEAKSKNMSPSNYIMSFIIK